MDEEVWKPVRGEKPWCDIYEVSNCGRVRYAPRVLKPTLKAGYPCLALKYRGQKYDITVHRLVADAFIDKVPGCNIVNHKNFDRADNRVENLEWVTAGDNVRHSAKALRLCRVIKMNPSEVRRLHLSGVSMMRIGKMLGASTAAVSAMIKRMKSDGRYNTE